MVKVKATDEELKKVLGSHTFEVVGEKIVMGNNMVKLHPLNLWFNLDDLEIVN
jgi:hypothetical protein